MCFGIYYARKILKRNPRGRFKFNNCTFFELLHFRVSRLYQFSLSNVSVTLPNRTAHLGKLQKGVCGAHAKQAAADLAACALRHKVAPMGTIGLPVQRRSMILGSLGIQLNCPRKSSLHSTELRKL